MALSLTRQPGYNELRPVFVPSRILRRDTGILFNKDFRARAGR
jgi:hypothetical protein